MSNQSNSQQPLKPRFELSSYTFNLCEMPNHNTIMTVTIMAYTQSEAFRSIMEIWKVKDGYQWLPGNVIIFSPLTLDRG